jgi:hypothetical protein
MALWWWSEEGLRAGALGIGTNSEDLGWPEWRDGREEWRWYSFELTAGAI